MAVKPSRSEKKILYDKKLCALLSQYSQILIVHADNVGSNQLQSIRSGLRGDSVVLMGKNTMMKRTIKIHAEASGNEAVKNILPLLVVCFIWFFPCLFGFSFVGLFGWWENVWRTKKMDFGYRACFVLWVSRKWIQEELKKKDKTKQKVHSTEYVGWFG